MTKKNSNDIENNKSHSYYVKIAEARRDLVREQCSKGDGREIETDLSKIEQNIGEYAKLEGIPDGSVNDLLDIVKEVRAAKDAHNSQLFSGAVTNLNSMLIKSFGFTSTI